MEDSNVATELSECLWASLYSYLRKAKRGLHCSCFNEWGLHLGSLLQVETIWDASRGKVFSSIGHDLVGRFQNQYSVAV